MSHRKDMFQVLYLMTNIYKLYENLAKSSLWTVTCRESTYSSQNVKRLYVWAKTKITGISREKNMIILVFKVCYKTGNFAHRSMYIFGCIIVWIDKSANLLLKLTNRFIKQEFLGGGKTKSLCESHRYFK